MSYNLKDLLTLEEIEESKLAGPLRYMYWLLARQIITEPKLWEEYMSAMTSDVRFCVQNSSKKRELRDRLTISLVRGNSMKEFPVTELMWNRFVLGLVLLKINHCTITVNAKKKLNKKDLEKSASISFNPMLLAINKPISNGDTVKGVGTRLAKYLKDPTTACLEMRHPLGIIYWAMVREFNANTHWEAEMDKYLTNPEYCVQLKQHRNDRYSNIKKAICNRENLTWGRLMQALVALSISEIDFTIRVTDTSDNTYDISHTVDMTDLKFIKVGGDYE